MKHDNENRRTSDDLDRTLDAVLARYGSVEPRTGLEERILANLRSADVPTGTHAWWTRRMAAVLAAVLMIALLGWRWNKASRPPIVIHRPEINEEPIAPRVATRETNPAPQTKWPRRSRIRTRVQPEIVGAGPKLDVFPSPLPLSEQEKILALYVEQYPQHAALVAEARMEALRQQEEERQRVIAGQDSSQ